MKYQNTLSDNRIECSICPRKCKLSDGQSGFCFVRENNNGEIKLKTYGINTGLAIDPVEKKPLYHFYPTSNVLSFGTNGCIMGCQFCQNDNITKVRPMYDFLNKTSPEEIVNLAIKNDCQAIAFTYNDPIAFFEYAVDTAKIARKNNIKTIAVTSGYLNPEPCKEFFEYMDATNIDLKGFSEKFYKKNCLAHLQPVLDTIKYVKNNTNCWLELTTLLIEGENTSDQIIENECDWIINNLGKDVPLHFSAFFPRYKFKNHKPTTLEILQNAYNIATRKGLNYIYTGNISDIQTSTTYCKNCGKPLIIREGYSLLENNLTGDKCKFCGTKLDGIFD
ncbi:MAG: AmmeMemoRadiSam system radical SAM enzyme [Clostridiaceae bacterium]|jgi:pyruvate formate lyase activating enzyme|nr:AmmeMemoRadiSam system radical SAM enzyme [Clostridiaceae bacterium]